MDINENETSRYEATISSSKEESIAKAMEIMMADIQKNEKVQVITRPKVSLLKGLIPIALLLGGLVWIILALDRISSALSVRGWVVILSVSVIYLVIGILFAKKLLIWMILIYQRFAPEKVRKLCRFQPSCSEYMKLAINKYGVVRGVCKGCGRLSRCHWPNGGIDEP